MVRDEAACVVRENTEWTSGGERQRERERETQIPERVQLGHYCKSKYKHERDEGIGVTERRGKVGMEVY